MSRYFFIFFCLLWVTFVQAKPVEIVLWHSLAGHLGTELTALSTAFNQSQRDFVIKPIYKGDYIESLTSFAAAFRAHQPPALVQVFEVGTATMLTPTGIIKPVDELMKEQGHSLPVADFFPAVRAYYSDDGELMAMPFNTSVPALFYNADALAKVGYSSETFPKTWDDLEILAMKLKQAGFACAYTSAYPAWIMIESFSAIHGLPLSDTLTKKAMYNNEHVINHLSRLRRWQGLHYFEYGGRSDDATILFTSGRCPLLSQSSGAYNGLSSLVPFHIGIAAIPLDTKASNQRFNNVAGGAALWAVAGQSSAVYQGIAQFFVYLADPLVQQGWSRNTGYLPLGVDGVYQEFRKNRAVLPTLQLAKSEFTSSVLVVKNRRLGAQNQIRAINDEAIETIFAGLHTPKDAMDQAVARANHAQQRFARNTSD